MAEVYRGDRGPVELAPVNTSLTLDDLLQGMREDGNFESTGQVTLDLASAASKMRSFQLPDPYFYCLKWVQAAVLGGAKFVDWRSDRSNITVNIGGMSFNSELMPQLPSLLFDPRATPAEQCLGAGMNSIVQTKAQRMIVTAVKDKVAVRGVWLPGTFSLDSVPTDSYSDSHSLSIEIQRTPSDSLSEFWYQANHFHVGAKAGSQFARDREQKILHKLVGLAPVPVTVQDFPCEEPRVDGPSDWHMLKALVKKPTDLFLLGKWSGFWVPAVGHGGFSPSAQMVGVCKGLKHAQRCQVVAMLPSVRPQISSLQVVLHGVLLEPKLVLPGIPGGSLVVCGADLKTDLTGLQIVEDEQWSALLEKLSQMLQSASS